MKIPKWLHTVLMYAAWIVTMAGALFVAMAGRESLNMLISVFFPVDPTSLHVIEQVEQRRTLDRFYIVLAGIVLLGTYVYFEAYLHAGVERRNLLRNFARIIAFESLVLGVFWLVQALVAFLGKNILMGLSYLLPLAFGAGLLYLVTKYLKKNPPGTPWLDTTP